jgi:potassium/chloride transporter 9
MITFAEQPAYEPRPSRLHSRTQSRQNSRPHSRQPSRAHSRQNSRNSIPYEGDISVDISSLLESTDIIDHAQTADPGPVNESSSDFSGQSEVALSFNDLPSKAQHLIINELMRRHSRDTAVLLTTLPIPAEGTSQDELATIQYLSNIELLCNELPPTLMVLSNNMTVTISL